MRQIISLLLILGLLAGALAINLVLMPERHLISSLYAVPALVACIRLSPRQVAAIAVGGVLLYVTSAAIEPRPPIVWTTGGLTLSLAGYLMVRHADQRQLIVRRARETDQARHQLQMFLGMVSHDLGGALTNLLAGADLLSREPEEGAETDRHGRLALDGATRQMQRLLSDLRDAAAIGAGGFSVRLAHADLMALAHEVAAEHQIQTAHHSILVDGPRTLHGQWDADRLRQLLTNLVSNAVKYSPAGGEVRVSLRRDRHAASITVADHGVGIAPDQGKTLFQPFSRLESGLDVSGSGLGLAISKAIVEAHGGHISVQSVPGNGSVFTVELPRDGFEENRAAADTSARAFKPEPSLLRGSRAVAG